jgi:hypothetical protein
VPKKVKRSPGKARVEVRINCDIAKILGALVPALLAVMFLKTGGERPPLAPKPSERVALAAPSAGDVTRTLQHSAVAARAIGVTPTT